MCVNLKACKYINLMPGNVISYQVLYSMIVLYIRDHEELGLPVKNITLKPPQLGTAKPKKCLQTNSKPFQKVSVGFKNFLFYPN